MQLLMFATSEIILRRAAGPYIPLLGVDFVDGRNIPLAAIGRSGVGHLAWAIDYVRYLGC